MTLTELAAEVKRTQGQCGEIELGLVEEVGELIGLLKKHRYHGRPLEEEKMKLEVFDVLWYTVAMADCLGFTLDDVVEAGVTKLRRRYPNGFTVKDSVNREEQEDES